MIIHPLKQAYIDVVWERYGARLGRGDKNPERTEVIAQKVIALGLDYNVFVSLAVRMWDGWADRQGWPYPYWNVVTGDATFQRLEQFIDLGGDTLDIDTASDFEAELMFAVSYVKWVRGLHGSKPRRIKDVCIKIQVAVAEHICRQYGVPSITSDLNYIAEQLGDKLD